MTTIKAVLFDYGMVLTGPQDEAAKLQMQTLLHTDAASFAAAYWRYRDAYDRGALSGVAYWHAVAKDLGQALEDATLEALLRADVDQWTQPNEPMMAWAKGLQRAGVRTGLLSNIGDAMEAGIVEHYPWLLEFSHRTFSHRLGIAKPDAAIYAHAIEGLGVPAGQILFVDDREENVLGARQAGMMAIQYGEHAEFEREMERMGLAELLKVGEPLG